MTNQKKRNFDYEDRFGKSDDSIKEKNTSEIKRESYALADICDLCGKWTPNILKHLRMLHPIVYQKMTYQ